MSFDGCVSRDFQKNAILTHLSSVPGIDSNHRVKLQRCGICTPCHLIGVFFSTDRNVDEFQNLLIQQFDFNKKQAAECAHALNEKFKNL